VARKATRTSEDINNVAYALMLKGARDDILLPKLTEIQVFLTKMASEYADMSMLSRTHGQPASPTTFGKEIAVFAHRLSTQIEHVTGIKILAKFNGATGTFGADFVAYPDIDWPVVMKNFIESLGLEYNPLTTQIEPHDWIARLNNEFALSGTIATDLCRDFWAYISMGYLRQTVDAGQVGSSTMPHKVNPIYFENAESNFGLANALMRHLSEKLPISRLQRDLSDSSALRSLSTAYGHFYVALQSLQRGLSKVYADSEQMTADLENEWAVLTEAVQTVMRKNCVMDAYNKMKDMSRGKPLTAEALREFVQELNIDDKDRQMLLNLTPASYTGLASNLAKLQ
jgi:adenylosuccinate lyase